MAEAGADALTQHYIELQSQWKVSDAAHTYARLVVPNGNASQPFHRWFHLKEAYSSSLIQQIFRDANWSPDGSFSVLDPFTGSGTTLLSSLDLSSESSIPTTVAGVERNPFIWELASAKMAGRIHGNRIAPEVDAAIDVTRDTFRKIPRENAQIPEQSTLSNVKYFPRENVQDLVILREVISQHESEVVRNILRACLASSVEACGRLRRDGRALRYEPKRIPRDVWSVFSERASDVVQDLRLTDPLEADARISFGDGRNPPEELRRQAYDWIIFSPPYPNNIDYTEVYKTEAWILGCYTDAASMRNQRLSTVRSHPSVRFSHPYAYTKTLVAGEIDAIIQPILKSVPEDKYENGRREVIRGYFDDMFTTLQNCRNLISQEGRLVFVVGNSAHGSGTEGFVIAADLVMAGLAELAGWQVDEIKIARRLSRRNAASEFLRESVVSLCPA